MQDPDMKELAEEEYYASKEKLPKLDDITDSMAIAICHAHSSKFSSQFKL